MMRIHPRLVLPAAFLALLSLPAGAASFDCAKARSPIEKAICATPELSRADEELAAAYRAALASFPVPGFVRETQRAWLRIVPECLARPGACLDAWRQRAATLRAYGEARVYTSYGKAFSPDEATLVVLRRDGADWLEWFGHWMPDAYRPRPYPDGFLAHDSERLVARDGGLRLEAAEVDVRLSDDELEIPPPGIMLSARQGPITGTYRRVR